MKRLLWSVVLLASAATADVVETGSYIVAGNLCVGVDCSNGEAFTTAPVNLKENNLRIRLQDAALPTATVTITGADYYYSDTLGDSWSLIANDTANGGASYLSVSQVGATAQTWLSDGTAVNYTCYYTGTTFEISGEANAANMDVTTDGVIAAGDPWEDPYCSTRSSFVSYEGLRLGAGTAAGVALGRGSVTADETVSVGNAGLLRRLVHLADAVNDVDVVTVKQMQAAPYEVQKASLDALENQLTELEAQVSELEVQAKLAQGLGLLGSGSKGGAFFWLLPLAFIAVLIRRR